MPNLFADDDALFVDPDKDWLSELVGEGKPYADTKALAYSKAENAAHSKRLELENKDLRNELKSRVKFEEFLDKLDSSDGTDGGPPITTPPVTSPVLKTEDIERLLEQKINQRDQARIAEQNINTVQNKLRETLGPNFAPNLKRQADDLGISEQYVQQLAASNPKAFFKLFGVEDKQRDVFTPPPNSSSTSFSLSSHKGKYDSFYENLRKTDPETFRSARIQNEIFDRIKDIGAEEFYSK